MHVRRAQLEDAVAVAELATQLGYPTPADAARERLARRAEEPAGHAVVVTEGDAGVTGWIQVSVALRIDSPPCGEIAGLVVDEAHRGAGVGEELVSEAARWARERGVAELRVRSNVLRKRAHRFYARLGFERVKSQVVLKKPLD